MEQFIIEIANKYPIILTIIAGLGLLVPFASFLANLTPNKTDDKIVAVAAKVIDWLALNFNVRKK